MHDNLQDNLGVEPFQKKAKMALEAPDLPELGMDSAPSADVGHGDDHGEAEEDRSGEPALESGIDDETLQRYRQALIRRYGHAPTDPLGGSGCSDEEPSLRRLYVDLDTEILVSDRLARLAMAEAGALPVYSSALRRPDDLRPLSALEAVACNRRVLLIGEPGSGKSMFIQALCLALANGECSELGEWDSRKRLPVVAHLDAFGQWLSARSELADDPGRALWDYLREEVQQHSLGLASRQMDGALQNGDIHLLLDGLDEVRPESLSSVWKALTSFGQRHPEAWLLVTSRSVPYEQTHWQPANEWFVVIRLAPLDQGKVQHFLTGWYRELANSGAGLELCRNLNKRLGDMLKLPALAGLAGNPMTLCLMALVYGHDKVLPDHRSALYERAINVMLWYSEDAEPTPGRDPCAMLRAVGLGAADLLRVLRGFAAISCRQHGDNIAHADALLQAVAGLHRNRDRGWARGLLEQLCRRGGLLVELTPGEFAFSHHCLQEYLAGAHLALNRHFVAAGTKLAESGGHWREVILLAVGYRVHILGELDLSMELASALCPPREPQTDRDWRIVQLAAEVLLEIGLTRIGGLGETGVKTLKRVRRQLTILLDRGKLTPPERARAGDQLARLGDPRFDPHRLCLPCRHHGEPDRGGGFVRIPAGSCFLGGAANDGRELLVEIPYAYWLARFPVTVGQFAAFVADAGYADQRWWRSEIAGRWLRETRASSPGDWDTQRRYSNRPVTRVSWYEANAYCAWLDARLRALEHGPLPSDFQIRLPSAAEWVRAARGNETFPYPWGHKEWDAQHANVAEGNIGKATAVGMYPQGATASGLHDLAGNVWEWTLNNAREQEETTAAAGAGQVERKVLLGGSWSDSLAAARIAYRGSDFTVARDAGIGFRLVISVREPEH